MSTSASAERRPLLKPLSARSRRAGAVVFIVVLAAGLGYAALSILGDVHGAGEPPIPHRTLFLLALAMVIALGFEFVNGFHDTANAVATVIYTRSLPPVAAVLWSGMCNFAGVLSSSGAVAFTVVTLLPIELTLQVGSGPGYAMIFAMLLAAIVWNLGTWAMGLPNSSSHALIGSIMGVGLANQLVAPSGSATSGVDWRQALSVLEALLLSPVLGFGLAALAMVVLRRLVRSGTLFRAPEGDEPPPWPVRALLVLTCTGVSFFHGSNDGQKGMGLIMLILIGAAPTAYALNRAIPASTTSTFLEATARGEDVFRAHAGAAPFTDPAQARAAVGEALRRRKVDSPATFAALAVLTGDVARQVREYGSLSSVPSAATQNVRNDMYLASDAVRVMGQKPPGFSAADRDALKSLRSSLDSGTKYIPTWVKVIVALALGLGTTIGWKRIVVTVGEKIGKTHLTYAAGASAETVTMGTIALADGLGLPVSTTHVLSSGVAGTMWADGAGLQRGTVRNLAMAWVLTLPAAMVIAGSLYVLLRQVF